MRFVDIKDRVHSTVIEQLAYNRAKYSTSWYTKYHQKIKETKWNHHKWRGLTLMKDPMTLSIYMMMFQDLKPKTILEFGTYDGGTALWMEDTLKSLSIECDIHTFDINQEIIKLPEDSKIICHELDNNKIDEFIDQKRNFFEGLESPIIMIEDSHTNAARLVKSMDQFLKIGDYLVIEDTLSKRKYNETILSGNGINTKIYKVDTHYCDLWGLNNTWNVNSIFKKIEFE